MKKELSLEEKLLGQSLELNFKCLENEFSD